MNAGQKVRVRIQNPREYAWGAWAALDGLTGVVEAVEPSNYLGHPRESPYLVRFDEPAPKWWTHQTPATAFWFPATDLEVMP